MDDIEKNYVIKCNTFGDISEHLPTLRQYASYCESIVEFGVRKIVSTWALLSGKPKIMVSYDINDPKIYGESIQSVYEASKYANIDYRFILGDTSKIVIEWCDLLFIDTLHTYNQLKIELSLHGNKAKKYIIMHDTVTFGQFGEIPGSGGLNKAIQEFLEENQHWKIERIYENNNGLTILKREK